MPIAVTHDTQQEERFNALYTQFKQTVRRRVEFVLKDNYELYDDTEQETWLKAWCNLKPEREAGAAWLYRIATNAAYDALRHKYHVGNNGNHGKRQQRALPESLDADPEAYELIEAEGSAINRFHNREEIREMLELIDPQYRQICYFFIGGMTYIEIMGHLHYSKKVVWAVIRQMHERSRKARAEALV